MSINRKDKQVIVTPEELERDMPEAPREGMLKLTAEVFASARLEPWNRGGFIAWVKLRSGLRPNERLTTVGWLDIYKKYKDSPAG